MTTAGTLRVLIHDLLETRRGVLGPRSGCRVPAVIEASLKGGVLDEIWSNLDVIEFGSPFGLGGVLSLRVET